MDVAMKRRLYRLLLSLLAGLVVFLLFALHPRSTVSIVLIINLKKGRLIKS